MKKKLVALFMASAMAASLAACGGSSSSSSSASSSSGSASGSSSTESAAETTASTSATASTSSSSEDPLAGMEITDEDMTIDVILKTLSAEYWQYVEAGCNAFSADHPNITVEVKGPTSETAYDEQTNMIDTDLANSKYSAVLISPLQSDSVASQVGNATVPVLALDTNIESDDITAFVGTGNEAAAESGGKAAVEAAKELGWEDIQCIEIAGVQGDETNTARMTGYQKGVEEAGGDFLENETQYCNAQPDQAVACMEGIMSKYPDGVAIICANNDDAAMAAAKTAAGNEAYKNTIFLGFNGDRAACEAMAEGQYEHYMSVAQNAYEMGYKGVQAAVLAAQGETLPDFIDSGSSIITSENAQERVDTLKSYLQ